MSKSLVIVESPAKAKTINRYLGRRYVVKASMGHVRDLPRGKMGVDIEHDFEPHYVTIAERRKLVSELKKAAKDVDTIILAADPDREGEAISWHLSQLLQDDKKKVYRVLFHEITKEAVTEAFKHLGQLDQNKINAQQTRRILDRLVGYLISPLLWEKIGKGLSAGRVQSIALRLICEREKEIKAFVPEEYWTIAAQLQASNPPPFRATLDKIDGKKTRVGTGASASEIVAGLRQSPFILEKVNVREKRRNPGPPYITSTLQQESFRLLHFPVRKTMSVAQKLYEGMAIGDRGPVGLITYMRTDSVRVSDEAQRLARKFIGEHYPEPYLPAKPPFFKNKRKAQDAHEAIRPTSLDLPPDQVQPYLKRDEFALYSLIWNRFLASQLASAVIEETEFEIRASHFGFTAKGQVIKFDGFLVLYPNLREEGQVLPKAEAGETLALLDLESKQNFTQPPPRYTEGSLVKELEAKGIGRPSTYAPIISTLQDRVYIVKDKGKFIPTDLGLFVTDFLVKNFADLMEVKFTARMEEELDLISEGEQNWKSALREYYDILKRDMEKGKESEGVKRSGIPVEDVCPQCGRQLVIKDGRYGRFKACSGYPECKFRKSLVKKEATPLEEKCPECGSGLVMRRGKYGPFVACSNYPKCTYIKKENAETGIVCPEKCGGMIIRRKTRKGKIFFGCNRFPKCRFATWDEPVAKDCPVCKREFVLRKNLIKGTPYFYCWDPKCTYKETAEREKIWETAKKESDEKRD